MTRLLILSDSHGQISHIDDVLRKHQDQYDEVIHLGDQCSDMLSFVPRIQNYQFVCGNVENSLLPGFETFCTHKSLELTIEGLSVFLTHGHRFSLQATRIFLEKEAHKKNYRIVLYGHTHKQQAEEKDGVFYFNPGALVDRNYGLITLEKGKIIKVEHFYLPEKW